MKLTCEIIVHRVLPAIRAELAKILVKDYNCSQQSVSDMLNVSKAAISQYLSAKRGNEVNFSDDVMEEIFIFAKRLAEQDLSPYEKSKNLCKICKVIQSSDLMDLPGMNSCPLCGVNDQN